MSLQTTKRRALPADIRERILKTTFRKLALVLAASAGLSSAHAGVLTFQDVVFTTDWTDQVLTLEIDAARPGGNWAGTAGLGAIGIKDFGTFGSVSLLSAPGGTSSWQLDSHELTANGCDGGGNGNSASKVLCLYGGAAPLADNMVFRFAFTGLADFAEPHLKVNFLDSKGNQTGDLMSKDVLASATVVVPPPGTPGGTPGTPGTPPPVVVQPPLPEVPASNAVPEPQSIALTLAGLFLMGTVLRKRS